MPPSKAGISTGGISTGSAMQPNVSTDKAMTDLEIFVSTSTPKLTRIAYSYQCGFSSMHHAQAMQGTSYYPNMNEMDLILF